jgi:hypothetical protein
MATAYFLVAAARCSRVTRVRLRSAWTDSIEVWDACIPKIVFGRSGEDAQTQFTDWLKAPAAEGEGPRETTIRKITQTPFVDRFITESANSPLDWPNVMKQFIASLEATSEDDFEQGYWVDVDEVVRPDKLSFSAGTLESEVPEDIRSGLNWSGNKQFFFLFGILAPPPPPPADPYAETETIRPELVEPVQRDAEPLKELSPEELYETFPDACNKEAVVLVQARNSVVAAWLWRRYSAKTPLADKPIRIEPWPGTLNDP